MGLGRRAALRGLSRLGPEALQLVVAGEVLLEGARDNLVYNYNNQLVVGIDLEHMLVINTGDVLLVCPKTSVPKIKTIVEELVGTPHEHLI